MWLTACIAETFGITIAVELADGSGFMELQILDSFKTLLKMRLHCQWISGLSKNTQQFITTQEIETRELLSFGI